jgi:hypothetical protein
MSLSRQVTSALRDLRWLEEFGRANIGLPDGLYAIPSEPAQLSTRSVGRGCKDGAAGGAMIRAALRSFVQRWSSRRRSGR